MYVTCARSMQYMYSLIFDNMELWSAYNCRESLSYSGATHVQVGPYQASKKDVSVKATDHSASADSQGQEVRDNHVVTTRSI